MSGCPPSSCKIITTPRDQHAALTDYLPWHMRWDWGEFPEGKKVLGGEQLDPSPTALQHPKVQALPPTTPGWVFQQRTDPKMMDKGVRRCLLEGL